MFEREIKFIYDFNLNKVNRLGPYFTFEQLAATELHPAILQYISAEIDYLVFEDRQNLLKNSVFDYSGEKITYYFNQMTEELKKSKRFAVEYIAKLILHASSFTVNFLIRPKWTLAKFVFDEEKHKTSNEIKQILNYVYYYKYLTKILSSYINMKKILSMDVEEFEVLLNKADGIGVESYLPAILESALKSMAEFFNIGEVKKNRIPLPAVELFLEEKELFNHLDALKEIFGEDENSRFNLVDYHKVLSRVTIEKKEPGFEIKEYPEFASEEVELSGKEEPYESEPESMPEAEPFQTGEEAERPDVGFTAIYEKEIPPEEEENGGVVEETGREESGIQSDEPDNEKLKDEAIPPSDEEVIIKAPVKLRIHIEDGRIEPIYEETEFPAIDEETGSKPSEPESEISALIEGNEETGDEPYKRFNELMTFGPGPSGEPGTDSGTAAGDDKQELLKRDEIKFSLAGDETEKELRFDLTELGKEEPEGGEPEDNEVTQKDFASLLLEADARLERESSLPKAAVPEPEEMDAVTGLAEESMFEVIRDNSRQKEEKKGIDLAEILEHKEMSKIIQTVFDYDIEDFASALDSIAGCKNADEAQIVITQVLDDHHINLNSKEAETFRSIILDFFDKL
jgi:hypothetical protein